MKQKNHIHQVLTIVILGIFILGQSCEKSKIDKRNKQLAEEAEGLSYLTENFPPYNYGETGAVSGVSADLLLTMFEKMDIQLDESNIILMNWSEAYEKVQNEAGTVLFSMVQNSERQDLFKWVGPIAPHKEVLISRMGEGIAIFNDVDMNKYTIGYITGYPSYNLLRDRGVDQGNLLPYPNTASLYEALVSKEVQCICYSEQANHLILAGLGLNVDDYRIAYTLQVDQLFFAFNLSVSDDLINFFQENLDMLKDDKEADGSSTLEKILNNYSIILHAEDNITEEMVTALVNQTAEHMEADAPGTIMKMNNQEAPYKDPDVPALYSFAYDMDLTVVAHSSNSSIVGINFKGKPDAAGKLFRDEILAGALARGTGWVEYIYTKPDKSGLYQKTTYYRLTTGSDGKQYIVCAGRYK